MALTNTIVREIRRLTSREKAALADHLWREAEGEVAPTTAQLARLNHRAEQALRHPELTKPVGDATRRLRK